MLLLDEPLSNLDAKLREEMRIELRELQQRLGITAIYVTHDQAEALALSDRIVVMRDGQIEQVGTPAEIYEHPRTPSSPTSSARPICSTAEHRDRSCDGRRRSRWKRRPGTSSTASAHGRPAGAELDLLDPHRASAIVGAQSRRRRSNVWPVRVERSVFQGDFTQTHVGWGGQRLVIRGTRWSRSPRAARHSWRWSRERVVLLEE